MSKHHPYFSDPSRSAIANNTLRLINETAGSILATTGYRPEEALTVTVFIKHNDTTLTQGASINIPVYNTNALSGNLDQLAQFIVSHYPVANLDTELVILSIYSTKTPVDEIDRAMSATPHTLMDLLAEHAKVPVDELRQRCGMWFIVTPGIKNGNLFTTVYLDNVTRGYHICDMDDTFTHIDTAQLMPEMIYHGFDPQLTREAQLATLLPVNSHYPQHTQQYVNALQSTCVPKQVRDGYDTHGYYRYNDVAEALNQLLDTVAVTSWGDMCHSRTIIEKAAWFFSTKTTRDVVIHHTNTRTDDIITLCRLVIASFSNNNLLMCNAVGVYAFCLVFNEVPNIASLLVKHTMETYASDMHHELLTLTHTMLYHNLIDNFTRVVNDAREVTMNNVDTFHENMHEMMVE